MLSAAAKREEPMAEREYTPEEQAQLRELYARRALCRFCIKTVSAVSADDPRRADALVEYNRQLAAIDGRIAAITGTPPPIVIGLKPAVLFPEAPKAGGSA